MNDKSIKLVEEAFKKYYFANFSLIHVPDRTKEREFGYQKFNSGMIRHISLKDDKELHLLLMKNVPSDVYCSNGYYSFPNLPMNEKDWKGADLIFDIDAKDLGLSCRKEHTATRCLECNHISEFSTLCRNCNSTKIDSKSLPCQNCISEAKNQVVQLLEILVYDLGINRSDIQIYFSGNEGFHVYAFNTQYQVLGSRERNELSDYIMFHGTIPETFGYKKIKPERSSFPELTESGWKGRVSKKIFRTKSQRSKIITELISSGYKNFQDKLQDMSSEIGIKIDPNVTNDIHRIFRLPGSLNSKSGLTKLLCSDIASFDPYKEACFLDDDAVDVLANCPLQFRLKNKKFGPFKNERVSLPTFAAIYLICKGLAQSE